MCRQQPSIPSIALCLGPLSPFSLLVHEKKAILDCISTPQDIQKISTVEELERFILEHGEQVVDILGSEVDRIEQEIKVQLITHYLLYQKLEVL